MTKCQMTNDSGQTLAFVIRAWSFDISSYPSSVAINISKAVIATFHGGRSAW